MHLDSEVISNLDKHFRTNLINGISGAKPACLIGTQNNLGINNLALFSNIIHIGANPPLMGVLFRPLNELSHTYRNIKNGNYFTINHISADFTEEAHASSAKFSGEISEFDACGLSPEFLEGFPAPFVKESVLKIGLKFMEEQIIQANNTILVIGQIEHIFISAHGIDEDGNVKMENLNGVSVGGLNTYYGLHEIGLFPYAKKDQTILK